jgi:Cu/Ag efflux protein CusF
MNSRLVLGLILGFATCLVAACGRNGAKAPQERLYDVKGVVVSVAPEKQTITVDHEDIPGLMKAMKMPFRVDDPKLLEGIREGDRVQGKVKVDGDYTFVTLEKR